MSSLIINPYSFGGGAATDPHFANVVFLWEADGANNDTGPFTDVTGKTITGSGTAKLSTTQIRLGSTSFFTGTGGFSCSNHADFRLGNSANSSQFTIEFSFYGASSLSNQEIFRFWQGSERSWWIRLQGDGEIRFLSSSDGSASFSMDITTTGLGVTADAWHDLLIDKDSSGKIRFYRGGVMKYSTTPANSVFFNSTNSPFTHEPGGANYFVDHIRLTKSVARVGSDSGYTFTESSFPTS